MPGPGAGKLDRRIVIERNTPTTNDFNEEVASWSALTTIWAERQDMSTGEMVSAGLLGAHIGSRFRVRANATTIGISPKDRIKYGFDKSVSPAAPVYWNVKANTETLDGRKRFRWIVAVADADVQFSETE